MMRQFRKENEQHIREIFEKKTGVSVGAPKKGGMAKTVIALGLAAVLTSTAVFASEMFSSLDGDDLSLGAVYEGNGVVSVFVENRSGKPLVFQERLKLLRWNTQEELPAVGQPSFTGGSIPPHSDGVMTIDLSQAYDVDFLEQPLENGDSYYFLLTNNSFLFGQDWICTVPFTSEEAEEPAEKLTLAPASPEELGQVEESLRFYFASTPIDTPQRQELDDRYEEAVQRLFSGLDGTVVPTAGAIELLVRDPEPSVCFDPNVPQEEQYLLTGLHLKSSDWDYKLLATKAEKALVLSAAIPMERYPDASGELPLFYLFPYPKAEISPDSRLFVHGQLLAAAEAREYLVFEDAEYLCYDFSAFFYSDLGQHMERFAAWHPELRWDEDTRARVERVSQYYQDNLDQLVYRRQG